MATFKVGQRVRAIYQRPASIAMWGPIVGREGVIIGPAIAYSQCHWSVRYEGDPRIWEAEEEHIAPLTDPGADAFMERIKKLKVYDEPLVVKTKPCVITLDDVLNAILGKR